MKSIACTLLLLSLSFIILPLTGFARFDPKDARVEDRLAIYELFTEYCTAIDTRNKTRFREVFTHDAVLDYSANVLAGKGPVDEMEKQIIDVLALFSVTIHQWSNPEIEFTGPNTAKGRIMLHNPMFIKGFPVFPLFTIYGYYNHELVKLEEDGRWRSKYMKMEVPVGAYGQILLWILIAGLALRHLRIR